jgi:hypothetical protein
MGFPTTSAATVAHAVRLSVAARNASGDKSTPAFASANTGKTR